MLEFLDQEPSCNFSACQTSKCPERFYYPLLYDFSYWQWASLQYIPNFYKFLVVCGLTVGVVEGPLTKRWKYNQPTLASSGWIQAWSLYYWGKGGVCATMESSLQLKVFCGMSMIKVLHGNEDTILWFSNCSPVLRIPVASICVWSCSLIISAGKLNQNKRGCVSKNIICGGVGQRCWIYVQTS